MIYFFKYLYLSVLMLMFTGCGQNKSEADNKAAQNDSQIPDKKMCELLTKETMTSLTGINFIEEMSTLHQTDNKTQKYVSQCAYQTDGAKIGVLVRRFGNMAFPTEKENIIGGQKTGNKELDDMMETAIQTAKTVTGLGDAAYFYDLGGINNLVVVFQSYYQLHITSYGKGFGFDEKTLDISEKVAKEVIKIFTE